MKRYPENQSIITDIQNRNGNNYISFKPINFGGLSGETVERYFRKSNLPQSEINNKENIQQDDYYFLNNMQEDLIQNSYKDSFSKDTDAVKYEGNQIRSDDIDEFDFS